MTLRTWLLPAAVMAAALAASCAPIDPITKKGNGEDSKSKGGPRFDVVPPGDDPVKHRIKLAIEQVRRREVLTTHGFWSIFHGILGLGPSLEMTDAKTKKRVNALEYICGGGELPGLEFRTTANGLDVHTNADFISQGHQDQFVAEMAQWNTPASKVFRIASKDYTFLDFVRHSQMRASVTGKQELSWAIVVIGQYFGTDAAWTNEKGEKLHFEDLIRYETKESIEDAACGGTHRLFGLTWAYHIHLRKGGKTEGVWKDVADRLDHYKALARKYQNPDGSLSTGFFKERGAAKNKSLRMNTTGHTLEWLALVLTDAELKRPWVEEAAKSLAMMFLEGQNDEMDMGSMYHAVHGLLMYYARVYGTEGLGANRPFMILRPGDKG